MAKTIEEIEQEIITAKEAQPALAVLTSTSKFSIWRLIVYVVATAIYTIHKLMDAHKKEVADTISKQKTHTEQWYAEKAKMFQRGFSLVKDSDYYDNTGIDEAIVEASKVVKYSAVGKAAIGLEIKIATEAAGELEPLNATDYAAFQTYMQRVKDAGVYLRFKNQVPDSLKLELDIYYDPLVITPDGKRIDGTNDTPVDDAIKGYLKSLEFNAKFKNIALIDTLQGVDGVKTPVLISAQSRYGALPYSNIDVEVIPDAGYLKLYNTTDLVINYKPYEAI